MSPDNYLSCFGTIFCDGRRAAAPSQCVKGLLDPNIQALEFEIVINPTGVQSMDDLDKLPDLTVMVHCCHLIHLMFRSFITCQCLLHLKAV